jgi:hypothetical protein
LEATRDFDIAQFRTTYNVKVEYKPSAGKTAKSITIRLYENLGPDGNGGFKKGAEKDNKTFPSPPVNQNGSTDWFQINSAGNNNYLISAELEESDGTVTPAPKLVVATAVIEYRAVYWLKGRDLITGPPG